MILNTIRNIANVRLGQLQCADNNEKHSTWRLNEAVDAKSALSTVINIVNSTN
ncbi:hypothetical protein KCTCHS21_55120 [Cohnella abietis]|uniref:Uncharacterized protein n=1 Tax=Cohnella abietis TaxID=2507935 RepID=A0A3T1DDF0_9BACL|nr:hypothetical protein KCTCHS21_55120 [Cohnella abietis]